MAPSVSYWHKLVSQNYRLAKEVWKHVQNKAFVNPQLRPQPIPIRVSQPLHPVAAIRQAKGRWYTTHSTINATIRQFTSGTERAARGVKYDRSTFPKSRVGSAVNNFTGRAPFASTLRPNLTGGTLGRTSGGYSLGAGGARYFSHTPAAPAQVIQNVSQAMRAFCLSGKKAQFDGVNPVTGEKRYRSVTVLQKNTTRKIERLPKSTSGSYVNFYVNPTITALTPLSTVAGYDATASIESQTTLSSEGLLDLLSVDFSRALKDLAVILADMKRLSELGDLPISYQNPSTLRIHFPGCDAESVEILCREIGVCRGVVTQDDDFDAFVGTEVALLFPFASSKANSQLDYEPRMPEIEWAHMLPEHDTFSTRSESGYDLFEQVDSPIGSGDDLEGYVSMSSKGRSSDHAAQGSPLEYRDDFEGICRFIEMCDGARR